MSIRARLVAAAVTVPMTAAAVLTVAPAANAVDVGTIVSYVKQAYDAYKMLTQTHEMTLTEATNKIIAAVNTAKAATISHIDLIATADVRSCAMSAVIDFEDFQAFDRTTQQAFARDATSCVTLAEAYLETVDDSGTLDQLGFAVNVVGPIALIARSNLRLSTGTLTDVLIAADNTIISKLPPRCSVRIYPYFGDNGKPIPSLAENVLTCVAYNGDRAQITTEGRMPQGGFNFSVPRARAAARTSYAVAVASLAQLTS
jgi:hypothetical protein